MRSSRATAVISSLGGYWDADERHGAIGRDLGVGHGDDIIEFSELGSDLIDLREVIGDGFAGNDRRNHELCTGTGGVELGGFEQDERIIAVLTRNGEGVFEVRPIVELATTTAAARRNHEPTISQGRRAANRPSR